MSIPPTTHVSSIPSTVRSGGDRIIAPGAENVGQAKIVTELSKPFALQGLFGDADQNAFDAEIRNTEESSTRMEQEDFMEDDAGGHDA